MQTWLRTLIAALLGSTLYACPGLSARASDPTVGRENAPPALAGPLSLEEAVRIAIEHHPSVEASEAALRSAAAQVRAARSSQRLVISAANYFSDSSAPLALTAPSSTSFLPGQAQPFNYGYTMPNVPHYGQNIMAMLPVYNGGRTSAAVRSAVAMRQAAQAQSIATEQEIALRAKETYHGVLLAEAVTEARHREAQEVESRLKEVEERHRSDGVALYEVQRHRAELARARRELTDARRDLAIARLDLNMILGLPEDARPALSGSLALQPVQGDLAEQLATAEQQSPELEAAEARCDSAEATDRAARRASRPSIYACLVQANAANIGARGLGGTLFAVCGYYPLFDSGLRRAAREQTKAQVEEEKALCEAVQRKVKRDVTAAWLTLHAAAENVRDSAEAASLAEESYRALQLRYEARRATQAELFDSLAALTRARLDHLRSLYDHRVARARLDRAVGRV
jgi:outer membrane protein TolC